MAVKIMVRFWIPNIIRHLIFRVPKRDHNFDNHPYVNPVLRSPDMRVVFSGPLTDLSHQQRSVFRVLGLGSRV